MSASTEIISFYSFKGGTGRSTALANVAHSLAEMGMNVGCMDLDLAAPGLHMIFPDLDTLYGDASTIHGYLRGEREIHNIENYIIDIGEALNRTIYGAPDGELLLIAGDIKPPGSGNPKETMLRALQIREHFVQRRDLDYLFIDSRSGLSNHMIPLFDEAHRFLAFHRWTYQHKRGTEKLAEWLDSRPVTRGMEMMSVASNVPDTVDDSEVESWVTQKLYGEGFSNHHIINSSDILRGGEQIVALRNPDAPVVKQYRELAEIIKN